MYSTQPTVHNVCTGLNLRTRFLSKCVKLFSQMLRRMKRDGAIGELVRVAVFELDPNIVGENHLRG